MKKQTAFLVLTTALGLILGGCAAPPKSNINPVINPEDLSPCDQQVLTNLKGAINHTGSNLEQLRKIKQGDWDGEFASNPPPVTSSMHKLVTIGWQGGIEDILRSIATEGEYKLQITGRKPPQPIIVNISVTDEPAYKVLENIGWQAGQNVSVVRNDVARIVKLIYREG